MELFSSSSAYNSFSDYPSIVLAKDTGAIL